MNFFIIAIILVLSAMSLNSLIDVIHHGTKKDNPHSFAPQEYHQKFYKSSLITLLISLAIIAVLVLLLLYFEY